jgi:hypothetical protein
MEIHGKRVTLRPVVPVDAAGFAAILETPEVASLWLGYGLARVESEFLVEEKNVAVYVIVAGDRLVGLIQTTDEPDPDFPSRQHRSLPRPGGARPHDLVRVPVTIGGSNQFRP